MLNGRENKAALSAVPETMVTGGDLVGHDEVRLHEVARGEIGADEMLQQLDRLLAQMNLGVAREAREFFVIHFHHIKLVEAEPLRGELVRELPEARVGNQARNLGVECGAQFAGSGQLLQARIRHGVPEKVRELRGQLVIGERLRLGRVAFLDEKQKLRRGQHDQQCVLDALHEVRLIGVRFLPHGHQRGFLGSGDRPAKGAASEVPHNLARVLLRFIFIRRADENPPVRRRRPASRKTALKFHRTHPQRGRSRPSVYSLRTPISRTPAR